MLGPRSYRKVFDVVRPPGEPVTAKFGGAASIMTEFAPPGRRSLYGAWQSFTVALGLLAGAGVAALLASVLTEPELNRWGWWLPFPLTLPLGLAALWLRLKLEESPSFRRTRTRTSDAGGHPQAVPPAPASAREVAMAIALGAGRLMGWSAAGYTFLVVMPSYLQSTLNATFRQVLVATVLANWASRPPSSRRAP